MTLSPNAQEFVPTAYSVPPIQTFVLDPSTGATSPVILSHIPLGYGSTSYYLTDNVMFYPPVQPLLPQDLGQSTHGPHEPYIADQNMYQKVFNNVSLIKQTIEFHYNNQIQTYYKYAPNCSNKNIKKTEKNALILNDSDFPPIETNLNIQQNKSIPGPGHLKAKSNDNSNNSTPKSGNQMINTEFYNMVTALRSGQNFYAQMNYYQQVNGHNEPICGTVREKNKKKKSTLKKIILREREEKKKQNYENLSDNSIETTDLNYLSKNNLFELEENRLDEKIDLLSPISQTSAISYSQSPANISTEMFLSLDKLEERVQQKIHSKKYREYCHQIINEDIDEACSSLLQEIVRFQNGLYHRNPFKAKLKRRFVMGIREVTKHLKMFKIKCVIIAPNCEKIESKGGLDDAINFIIQTSMEQNIPFLFALGRKGLGKAVNKVVPVSVIGIFDYSGAEFYFGRLVQLANNAKLAYQEMVNEFEQEECENLINTQNNVVNEINKNFEPLSSDTGPLIGSQNFSKIPSHMAHSRTPSNGSNISIEPLLHMNYYHSHSRSASGTFNYGPTTLITGHSRSASGGAPGGINLDMLVNNKNWTHARTPSNCSNFSFISRLSEPMSESDNNYGLNSIEAAVQFYNEQVKQEIKDSKEIVNRNSIDQIDDSLGNLHLGCINEADSGNDADIEDANNS